MSKIVNLTYKNFNNQGQLKNYKDKIVLIKFYTTWCGYCKQTIPDFENLANFYKNDKKVIIAQYDCDEKKGNEKNVEYIKHLNKFSRGPKIKGFPTIVLYKNNLYVETFDDNRIIQLYVDFINKYY
jgi:thiol-disulfide isomerase/thioredoxin